MSRFVNAVIVGIVAFIVLVAAASVLSQVLNDRNPSVGAIRTDWSNVDPASTSMNTEITFNNPRDNPVELRRVDYEVSVNDLLLDQASREENVTVPPGGEAAVTITPQFPASWVYDWFRSHVERGETSRLTTKGTAFFESSTGPFSVPFESVDTWNSHILFDLTNDLRNCPAPADEPCVESASSKWDLSSPDVVRLSSALHVENPTASPFTVSNRSGALLLAGTPVGSAEETGRTTLAPGTVSDIRFDVEITSETLDRWWPAHADACETSAVAFEVRLTFERTVNSSSGPGGSGAQPGPGPDSNTSGESGSGGNGTSPTESGPDPSGDNSTGDSVGPGNETDQSGTGPAVNSTATPQSHNSTHTDETDQNDTLPPTTIGGVTWTFEGSAFESHFVCGRETGIKFPWPVGITTPAWLAGAGPVLWMWRRSR